MEYQDYSPQVTHYPLSDELTLERAEVKDFAVPYTIYKNANPFYRQDWENNISAITSADPEKCFWIMQQGQRVGGVLLAPNEISALFLIPPFTDQFRALSALKKILVHWSDPEKRISAYGILPGQLDDFTRLGFWKMESTQAMLRPTEAFHVEWPEEFEVRRLRKDDQEELTKLVDQTHLHGIGTHNRRGIGLEPEDHTKSMQYYFDTQLEKEILQAASTVVVDPESQQIIAGCLISEWAGWPLVYEVFVHEEYQGLGLATRLIQHALDKVKDEYPVMRLFVTRGNPAETLYYNLGFLPMPETSLLYLPATR